MNITIDNICSNFKSIFGSLISEDDVKIQFYSKIVAPLFDLTGSNLSNTFKSEATLLQGGRPDALYQNVAFEYKKPLYFEKTKGIDEALYGRNDKDHGLHDYLISISDISPNDSSDILVKKLTSQMGVGFDGSNFLFARFSKAKNTNNINLKKTKLNNLFSKELNLPLEFKFEKFDLNSGVNRLSLLFRQSEKMSLSKENLLKVINPNNKLIRDNVSYLYHILIDDMGSKNPNNRIITLYSEWDRIFGIIYGNESDETDFTNYSDSIREKYGIVNENIDVKKYLFALQTYYNILIKLLIHSFIKDAVNPQFNIYSLSDIRYVVDLFEGKEQNDIISNFFEIHFYEWFTYSEKFDIGIINSTLQEIILKYELASFVLNPESMQDVLQEIYMGLIPDNLRHLMGEYFTPDWAVEFVLDKIGFTGDIDKRLCDPTCGSGAFLLQAIKRIKNNKTVEISDIQKITNNIVGFDINPISAVSAKANYILALLSYSYEKIDEINEKIHIPVYISDSVLTPVVYSEQNKYTLKIKTHLCDFVLPKYKDQKSANRFLDELSDSIDKNETLQVFLGKLKYLNLISDNIEIIVYENLFNELYRQHRAGKNSFWGKIFKNSFAPIMMNDKFDFVVGNPPWITWKAMSSTYREGTLEVWQSYGIFEKNAYDKKTTHDDFGMAVTYVAIDYYLKESGKLGFLLPASFLKSTKGGEGFRKFSITRNNQNVPFSVERVDDFSNINLFTINSMAIFVKKGTPMIYPMNSYYQWEYLGKTVKFDSHAKWSDVKRSITFKELQAKPVSPNDIQSAWLTLENSSELDILAEHMLNHEKPFYQGRKGIEPAGAKGVYILKEPKINTNGTLTIENDMSRQRRKDILDKGVNIGVVEAEYVYPMLGGRNIARWKVKSNEYMLVPHTSEFKYGVPESELAENHFLTHKWLSFYRKELFDSRVQNGKFFDPEKNPFYRLDNVGEYTYSTYKVLWKEQTGSMSAVVVSNAKESIPNFRNTLLENKTIVVDSKVLFLSLENHLEAHYVCGIINSPIARKIIDGYAVSTNRGVDVLKYIKIEEFDKENAKHLDIANLSIKLHDLHKDKVPSADNILELEILLDQAVKNLYLNQ